MMVPFVNAGRKISQGHVILIGTMVYFDVTTDKNRVELMLRKVLSRDG
jgi:hypothetical protein